MALIKTVRGFTPEHGENCYFAENATIVGDVKMGNDCSIWFSAVVRGDVNAIRIGNKVNIQDGAIIHGTNGKGDTVLGDHVSVGHRAIIHGCKIEDNVLIGMGAIVLDDVVVPSNTIIAAGALVPSNARLESGFIYAGTPAKKLRALDPAFAKLYIDGTANGYVGYKEYYK